MKKNQIIAVFTSIMFFIVIFTTNSINAEIVIEEGNNYLKSSRINEDNIHSSRNEYFIDPIKDFLNENSFEDILSKNTVVRRLGSVKN